jgi:His-Xaa-Ser system protein HxsD
VSEIVVEFAAASQSLGALREAAYRLIGQASCQIDSVDGVHRCRLVPAGAVDGDLVNVRARFIDLVTDENLREKLASETEPTRNLILALAFGSLVTAAEASTDA